MRVLTVRQPWAWAIIHGGKDVENRVRNIAGGYRGPVAIHAGLDDDVEAFRSDVIRAAWTARWPDVYSPLTVLELSPDHEAFVRGAIIGLVDLVTTHAPHVGSRTDMSGRVSTCAPWGEPGVFHLELRDPQWLAEPILFRGALGLRTLPADVEAAVLAGARS